MNSLVAVFFVATMAYAQASVWAVGGATTLVGPANPGAIIKGPAAKAAVVGPDGSVITSSAQAGAVAAAPIAGGVVSSAVTPGVVATPGLIGVQSYAVPVPIASPWGVGLGHW
ncbi:uncharacterized protein LOC130445454 [Diorhabda sublineata]|uniref:uncharacterized protein LOC130445454 n=1 Tax=Diorhabda sublineata TaxID=1163346 RepID=UPI0024E16630|nr:uncharacterized protein LOC130445454 [Diorhabda sublineata]